MEVKSHFAINSVDPSGFGSRLGYARWLLHLRTGAAPSHAEIGREVGRTGPAVSGWMEDEAAPVDYRVHGPLADFLGVAEEWLIKNAGSPPRPALWKEWLAAREAQGRGVRIPITKNPPALTQTELGKRGRGGSS